MIIFITRVAQEALRLQCVCSFCCGALHHAKKNCQNIQRLEGRRDGKDEEECKSIYKEV
jgi:hypothetical protein